VPPFLIARQQNQFFGKEKSRNKEEGNDLHFG
jgi:hypothetical protein